jgi:hypothetical protein
MVFKRSGKANQLNERAGELGWVKELRQDALDTRREMEGLQDQVMNLRRQLATVTREAEHWITEYQFLHRTIWRESTSVERLRELVGPPPQDAPPPPNGSNGQRFTA